MSTASDGFAPDIVTLAVDYHRSPLKYRSLVLPPAELPEGAGKLLRAACGDGELLAESSRRARVTPSQFKAAAGFFIRQAFFARDADYYRVLGLRPTDDIERIKEHHRLLMKLFHPDRGDTEGDWTDALATRVNQAYSVLRRPESRQEYDASLRVPPPAAVATGGQQGVMKSRWVRVPRPDPGATIDTLPPSVRRHFPEFVLGGIGVSAALVVGALYLFEEPALTGSGAIGGPATSAPPRVAGTRIVPSTADKFTADSQSPEYTQADASRGGPPAEADSVASLSIPATADPPSPATVAPVTIAANESPAATASDAPIAIPTPPAPVAAKTVAPKAPAKVPEAPAGTPLPPRVPVVADAGRTATAPAPLPPKAAQANVPAPAKPKPTIGPTTDRATVTPPSAPPRIETVKPATVVAASAPGAVREVKTTVPEKTPPGKVVPPPAPPPAPTVARTAPANAGVPGTPPRAEVIPSPPAVPARPTAKTAVAGAAPVSAVTAAAPPVPRPTFPDLELERLIGRFIGSYEQGDLDRFMMLFHEDARTGEKKDNKAMTRKEYADLFTSTQVRQMMLQGLRWEKGEDLARAQGRFLARVAGQGDPHIREYAGSIRVEVANVGGDLLIKGLFHNIEAKKHIPRGSEASGAGGK